MTADTRPRRSPPATAPQKIMSLFAKLLLRCCLQRNLWQSYGINICILHSAFRLNDALSKFAKYTFLLFLIMTKIAKRLTFTATFLMLATVFWAYTPTERYFEITKNLEVFASLFKEVNTYYVDDVSPTELMKTGIDAMLRSLDPYTNYIPEDRIEDYRTMTTGQYGGIGASFSKHGDKIVIVMPYEDYPAYKAGLQIGDEIIAVDGRAIKDKKTADISSLLKGQAGTDLTLTVKRYGQEKLLEVPLTREKIKVDNVPFYGMVTEDVGLMQLKDFTSSASGDVKKALIALKEQGAKKIIFDLRSNPGGLLSEAINVSNLFIEKGEDIVSTKGKVSEWNKTYKALNKALDTDIPLAVLTNGRSASAAEIVSGVMQDYDRGILVGDKTFGKGLVQATRPLSYNSQLKVTTAKYYIPSGRCIQAIDYSNRDENGRAQKLPDSLRMAFKTRLGRTVYDGEGITPDTTVEEDPYTPIARSLISKWLIFDYATMYAATNDTIDDPQTFEFSDAQYDSFVAWLKDKDYDYKTDVEKSLEELTENAKKEKYYDDISDEIALLNTRLTHNKEKDLRKHKAEIKELLEQEIASRYFLREGAIKASFDNDKDVLTAVSILNNPMVYKRLLAGEK